MSHPAATSATVQMASRDNGEELARAELYGLLARLWHAPLDQPLRESFSVAVTEAPEPDSFLEKPWHDLVASVRSLSLDESMAEFNALFVAAGKAEVFAHASHHLAGALNERPLVELRNDLQALGLTLDPAATDTEDHVSFVLEVMRYLIAGDDVEVCNLEQQRRFFRGHLQPWVGLLCDSVEAHPRAKVYAALARMTRAFIEVETQGFDLIE